MGWLSSLFSFDSASQRSRKGQVFSSTHEAFSLPTSSPVLASHPDAFNVDALGTPDPEGSRGGSQYTYPPKGSVAYGYVPSSSGFVSRPGSSSLLPTHMDHLHTPNSAYPPLSKTWTRLRSWLNREYPELGDTLNYGILPQDLAEIEFQFGFSLPSVVRESYLCVDGQEAESAAGCSEGLFFGLTLLPLEAVLEEWRFWREVDDDPTTGANPTLREGQQSIPPGWVRKEYSQKGWIPLILDKAGNYVGIDLNPGPSGAVGQVIVFGRDFDTKVVLWNGDGTTGWAKWLASFVEELETGEGFEIGPKEDSEGSEDDVGYEGYFYGGTAPGKGDGGGAGSSGGLRYTGEYRGWNVLEAWADRSFRRWYDAGTIPDEMLQRQGQALEVQKAAEPEVDINDVAQQGTGTEIPIPILRTNSEHIPSPTVAALNHRRTTGPKAGPSKQVPPAIHTGKAPAPRPVELPTVMDIVSLPSPPISGNSSLEDLESGRHQHYDSEDVALVSSTRRNGKSPAHRDSSEPSDIIPMTPPPPRSPTTPRATTIPIQSPSPPLLPQDLLADTPGMSSVPVMASASAIPVDNTPPAEPTLLSNVTDATEEPEANPESSIRLIGSGGQAGVSEEPVKFPLTEEFDSVLQEADTTSIKSEHLSDSGGKKDGKKHKKSKSSLVNLKRFSLGGSKKRDSVSSLKEVNTTTAK